MKKKSLGKKLILNKTTITRLDDQQLVEIKGGTSWVWTCEPCDTLWNSCIRCVMIPTDVEPYC